MRSRMSWGNDGRDAALRRPEIGLRFRTIADGAARRLYQGFAMNV
jgi:hypothetical protein